MIIDTIYNFGTKAYNSLNKENVSAFMKTSLKIVVVFSIIILAIIKFPKERVEEEYITSSKRCVHQCFATGNLMYIPICVSNCPT